MKCYQCGTCTADCTAASLDEEGKFNPRRMVLEYYERGKVSELSWLCANCYKCYRCPKGVKPYEVLAEMREEMIRNGKVPAFVKAFVETVRAYGELDETAFFLRLMRSGRMMDSSIVISTIKATLRKEGIAGIGKTISLPKKSRCAKEVSIIFSVVEGARARGESRVVPVAQGVPA